MMAKRRPTPKQGSRGTRQTRRMQLHLARHILRLTKSRSIAEGAELVGLTTNDIKNLRAGNMPSLRSLLCLVRTQRVTPSSLLSTGELQPLPRRASLRGATERNIKARIQRISRESDPATLAEASGLSIASIYQYRSLNDKIGLHAFLAFVSAGFDADELLLGGSRKASQA